jgi:hypothetical protein
MNDPVRPAALNLLNAFEFENVPLTLNFPDRQGVVFIYSGDNWEQFSNAIRRAVDEVQENLKH